jgi:hypothetical protein
VWPTVYYRDVFAKNSEDALVKAIRDGLDLKQTDADGLSFPTASIHYGTEKVMETCVDAGATNKSCVS